MSIPGMSEGTLGVLAVRSNVSTQATDFAASTN
jgi:hypothetical protein